MSGQDTYKEAKEIRIGNAIVCVYRPDLKEEERRRRETTLQNALRIVGKEMYRKGMLA